MSNTDSTEQRDVYARVTAQIITAIEQGAGSWRMPWHTSGHFAFSPINVTSKKPYRGINTLCLWAAAESKGYESGEWGTYKQWQERGAQVRKGEKSTLVVFWKFANSADDIDEVPVCTSGRGAAGGARDGIRHARNHFAHHGRGRRDLADRLLLHAQPGQYRRDHRRRDFAAHDLTHEVDHLVMKDLAMHDHALERLLRGYRHV